MLTAIIMLSSDHDESGFAPPAAPGMEQYPHAGGKGKSSSSTDSSPVEVSRRQFGPNGRPRKECQPNWSGLEVLALIAAKEEEHEA
jgi:hypothetical protein